MPTSGGMIYIYDSTKRRYKCIFQKALKSSVKKEIVKQIKLAAHKYNLWPTHSYGKVIEDRQTQITFSALGQKAPTEVKKQWKKQNFRKKSMMKRMLALNLKKMNVKLGGSTSIDVTQQNIDKAFGVKKLIEIFLKKYHKKLGFKNLLFFGDNFTKHGNDYPIKAIGVPSIRVETYQQTLLYLDAIKKWALDNLQ